MWKYLPLSEKAEEMLLWQKVPICSRTSLLLYCIQQLKSGVCCWVIWKKLYCLQLCQWRAAYCLFWALLTNALDSANYFTYLFWCFRNTRKLDQDKSSLAVGCKMGPRSWHSPSCLIAHLPQAHRHLTLPQVCSSNTTYIVGIMVFFQSTVKSPGESGIIRDMIKLPYVR